MLRVMHSLRYLIGFVGLVLLIVVSCFAIVDAEVLAYFLAVFKALVNSLIDHIYLIIQVQSIRLQRLSTIVDLGHKPLLHLQHFLAASLRVIRGQRMALKVEHVLHRLDFY